MHKKNVLFFCTHNSARSQMAEGLLRALSGERYQAFSAGVSPTIVDPDAIRAMAEIGIDISGQRSKGLEEVRETKFDTVVTVCDNARESCPLFSGAGNMVHKSFLDPASFKGEERIIAFRSIRDELRAWIEENFEAMR
ncbi:MAG: arsenate reductase ArsC [Methanothrix sp.]|nr:MAG: arsenate reductase ArsC [Methanothrix sp.]